jgi:branched-subunit amino acid ABC-type transport system permease component
MVGALVIGMASEVAAIWLPELKQVVAFSLLVIILLVRPSGLWRSRFMQKVEVAPG